MVKIYGDIIEAIALIGIGLIVICFIGLILASVIRFSLKTIKGWFDNEE
jgi:hypothetical protein